MSDDTNSFFDVEVGTDHSDKLNHFITKPNNSIKRITKGTKQQEEFWQFLTNNDSTNLILSARAGTGKSSSSREAMHRIKEEDPTVIQNYCCFNKTIAEEFERDCPRGVKVSTLNSLGHNACYRTFQCSFDSKKTFLILDSFAEGKTLKPYFRKAIKEAVGHAKHHAINPLTMNNRAVVATIEDIIYKFNVECYNNESMIAEMSADVLRKSMSLTSIIDYDDQIWFPAIHNLKFPSIDKLYIDEAQDLDPAQHSMVHLLNPEGQTIIVGDPFQAIYGWRGASTDSINIIGEQLKAITMPLTITWRCPKSHVDLAKRYVSDYDSAENAKDGFIERMDIDNMLKITKPGDLVICRTNAPIIQACLKKIANREKAVVRGRNIGDNIKSILRKIDRNNDASTIAILIKRLEAYKAEQVMKLSEVDDSQNLIESLNDRILCLKAILESCSQPDEIDNTIDELFENIASEECVTFSSIHRAKGSEAERVFFIQIPYSESRDKKRPPEAWELQQRINLEYVALTRSKNYLALVNPSSKR